MDTANIKFGRIYQPDSRDNDFPLSAWLKTPQQPFITKKYWWDDGIWLDQGDTPQCTAYSWSHWLADGPVVQDGIANHPVYDPAVLYSKFQLRDNIPGPPPPYDGSTIRAGATVLKLLGFIQEYRWAQSIDDVVQGILTLGPMVVGTMWFNDMFKPDNNYVVHVGGNVAGGHAYVLNGVDLDKKLLRIKNSWGHSWRANGNAYISFDDFDYLLTNQGEACMAVENRLTTLPDIEKIIGDQVIVDPNGE